MIDQVLFLRHGRTSYNLERRMQGQIDIPLDIVGQWQAEQSAYRLAQEYYWVRVSAVANNPRLLAHPKSQSQKDSDIEEYFKAPAADRTMRIVSSDLFRAQQTAHAFGDIVGLPVELDARLRERSFGRWEGMTRKEIQLMDPQAYGKWRVESDGQSHYGVESRRQVGNRAAAAVLDYFQQAKDQNNKQTLLIVGHGSWISAGIETLLGMNTDIGSGLEGMRNAFWSSLIPIRHKGEGLNWRLEFFNQGPPLAAVADWENGPSGLRGPGMPQWQSPPR